MDTLAPQSLLDNREVERGGHTLTDRLTRNTSPGRPRSHVSSDGETDEVVEVRVPQAYRTSFSAVLKPAKVKKDRSRSVSPSTSTTSSIKSNRSRSKSPGSRKNSARHVTYDSKVTVRHSDSYENETTALSGAIDPSFDPSFTEYLSPKTAERSQDYSSKIREMTQMIVKEYSENKESDPIDNTSSRTKERVTGRRSRSTPPRNGMANGQMSLPPKYPSPVNKLSREYDHDRTISYRQAITNHYSDEIKKLAEAKIEEEYPTRGGNLENSSYGMRTERSNSVPSQPETEQNNRLTPTKRTIGGSIGNFFRKLSPRLGRKSRKDKGSISSIDSTSQRESDENFSRNKVRNSFMKLVGRSRQRSGSKGRHDSEEQGLAPEVEAGFVISLEKEGSQQLSTSSNRILKSIEQNTISDRDVYQKFKDRQSPKSQEVLSNRPVSSSSGDVVVTKQQAIRATQPISPQNHSTSDSSHIDQRQKENRMDVPDLVRDIPRSKEISSEYARKDNVDGKVKDGHGKKGAREEAPRIVVDDQMSSSRVPHTSVTSSLSRDESIGDCSLDVNLTGSEPSLNNQGSESLTSSKRVILGSRGRATDSESALSPVAASTPANHLSDLSATNQSYRHTREHGPYYDSMPKLADSAEISIPECSKFPSYLKLSCAVSGYGRYSQYSSYKSIEKRSPYSSCSSLQSNPRSPEMPVTRVPPSSHRTHGSTSELSLISPQPLAYNHVTNGDITQNGGTNSVSNGHSHVHVAEDKYPTGDRKLDGEYFLNITRQWENRLLSHCQVVEADVQNSEVPEEVCGKIRAAVGKANLLISKKFKQFQELCTEHMYPSEDGKVPKWEDLQGFWDMIKLQADNVDDMFAEIELMRQNGWKELSIHSRASSVSSSPKSGSLSLSNTSTPCGTPGSRRKTTKPKETPESSPERTEKMRQAAKARDEARKKLLAERRAAMKQKQQKNSDVEIFVSDA